jgi:hypothetical protein
MEIRCATPVKIGQRIADGCDRERTYRRVTREAVGHAERRTSTRVLDGCGLRPGPSGIQGSGVSCVNRVQG